GKKMVEVTAAVDEAQRPQPNPKPASVENSPVVTSRPSSEGTGGVIDDRLNSLHAEMQEAKALMKQMLDAVEPVHALDPVLPPAVKRLWKRLVDNEVDPDLAMELINGVLAGQPELSADEVPETANFEQRLKAQINSHMHKAQITMPVSGK
ncbi:MAG: hypothetical protein ACM3ZQ_10145, partial [Bacillota bacterium]